MAPNGLNLRQIFNNKKAKEADMKSFGLSRLFGKRRTLREWNSLFFEADFLDFLRSIPEEDLIKLGVSREIAQSIKENPAKDFLASAKIIFETVSAQAYSDETRRAVFCWVIRRMKRKKILPLSA